MPDYRFSSWAIKQLTDWRHCSLTERISAEFECCYSQLYTQVTLQVRKLMRSLTSQHVMMFDVCKCNYYVIGQQPQQRAGILSILE